MITTSGSQQKVAIFMEAAGQEVSKIPTTIPAKDARLKVALLLEEVFELAEASGVEINFNDPDEVAPIPLKFKTDIILSGGEEEKQDLIGIADAIVDIDYVNNGAANSYGIPLLPCFDEVHENNMLKIENSTRDESGKLIKPANHPKPDLESILSETIKQNR